MLANRERIRFLENILYLKGELLNGRIKVIKNYRCSVLKEIDADVYWKKVSIMRVVGQAN